MNDDVPVFRSDAPHQVTVPQEGGNALSPTGAAPTGPTRQLLDHTVFAPLDEPATIDPAEIPQADEVDPSAAGDASVEREADGSRPIRSPEPEPEPEAERAIRIRRLSPETLQRANEIRDETADISEQLDLMIGSLPGFPMDVDDLTADSLPTVDAPSADAGAKEQ